MKATDSIVLLRSLAEAYEAACRPICHKMKLSQTAFDILMFLAAHPDCSTAKDICRARGIRPNMVSFNVQEIIEEGRRMANRFYSTILEGMSEDEIIGFEQNIALICRNAEKLRNS